MVSVTVDRNLRERFLKWQEDSLYLMKFIPQLLFYLYQLKKEGIDAQGELLIPKEKKKVSVELTDELIEKLKTAIAEIREIISKEEPPLPKKIPFCRNCAYREFCWV